MRSKYYYTKGSTARNYWLSEPILNLGAPGVRFRFAFRARSPPLMGSIRPFALSSGQGSHNSETSNESANQEGNKNENNDNGLE